MGGQLDRKGKNWTDRRADGKNWTDRRAEGKNWTDWRAEVLGL